MAIRGNRSEKVKMIFQQFDANRDMGLNRDEMSALVVAVNPRVKFSDEQIKAILDEVFRTYGEFIHDSKGLTYDGLLRTYDDGAGDVDRDFEALGLVLDIDNGKGISAASEASSSSIADERVMEPNKKQRTAAWAASPNHGIVFDDTWKLVDDLEMLIKRLKTKQAKDRKGDNNFDASSDPGWSREFAPSSDNNNSDRRFLWEVSGSDYAIFMRDLGVLRSRADGSRSREEAFDGHMALGKVLYDNQLVKESLVSFKRACELQPIDVRPHFRAGNCLYVLGRHTESKQEFQQALDAAESGGNQWAYLLPQIHVNLGISLEAEGMVLNACEHYREAAIFCPTHFRALKLLGSALFGAGDYRAAVKALEEATHLKMDYADAHCDLGSALHAERNDERAIAEFQKAIDLKPGHTDALYNLGGVYLDMGRYQRATEIYTRVLAICPNNWRAQVNKAVSLLGTGEPDEAKKSLKDALKMTRRVELHDTISHLKHLHKKKMKGNNVSEAIASPLTVDPSKFKTTNSETALRLDLASALKIRAFQRATRMTSVDVDLLKKEMMDNDIPVSYSGTGIAEKSIRKAPLEFVIRRLLPSLKLENFQGSVKAINEKILSVLDSSGTGRVDLGIFFAILAPICSGLPERRKRVAFEALQWRPVNEESGSGIRKADALLYFKYLRAVYMPPSHGSSEISEIHGGVTDDSMCSLSEFMVMFDDRDWGFGILSSLAKLEIGDRRRHGRYACSVCHYPIIGSRFKEMKSGCSLCNECYSQGKVPQSLKMEEYTFKEYESESEAVKDKCTCFTLYS